MIAGELGYVAIALLLSLAMCLKVWALTANANVDRYVDQEIRSGGVAAGVHIYRGAYLGKNPAGYLKPFLAGDEFAGIAYEEADNTSGLDGAIDCRVYTQGDFSITIASVAARDVLRPAYATDDNTAALTGHPDGFMGMIIGRPAANTAIVRLKAPGQAPPNGSGSIELKLTGQENFAATGEVAGTTSVGGFDLKSILGLGWTCNDAEDGGIKGEFDATAEIALASCRTRNDCLPVDKGVTIDVDLTVSGTRAAAIDIAVGLGTALTTNSEADISHADMVQLAAFTIPVGNNILFESDDNTTDVAAVDTTVDIAAGGNHLKVIARPTGTVEAWIDGVRVLSTTAFALLSTANVGAFVNMEKTADAAVGAIVLRNLRVAGGMASLAA